MDDMRTFGIILIVATGVLFSIQGLLVFSYTEYFEFLQIDRVLHFAGGALVALFAGWVIFTKPTLVTVRALSWFALILALASYVALAGSAWELYEFAWDELVAYPIGAPVAQPNLKDTMEDMMFNLLGGITSAALFLAVIRRRGRA